MTESGTPSLARRTLAELVATTFLLMAIVGSGIAASRLSPDQVGLQLLENAVATGAALVALILAFGSYSGAHMNPLVTLAASLHTSRPAREIGLYLGAQVAGAVLGTVLANVMFGLPPVQISGTVRPGPALWLGEIVATAGLLLIIHAVGRTGAIRETALAVGAYIAGAYWFTSSTSFANPAVTLGRILSDTFAGIAPGSALGFMAAQLVGAVIAVAMLHILFGAPAAVAGDGVSDRTRKESSAPLERRFVDGTSRIRE
jgi:glycerol uptake facilitator-like aquaporin